MLYTPILIHNVPLRAHTLVFTNLYKCQYFSSSPCESGEATAIIRQAREHTMNIRLGLVHDRHDLLA